MQALAAILALLAVSSVSAQSHAQTERVTVLGGPPTGVFGIFATGIATYLSKSVPGLEVSHAAGEGAVANVRRLNAGDAETAISFSSDVHEAFYGLGMFKENPATNVRAIGLVFIGVARLVTYADSGIQTVDDLPGRRVAVGAPGTGTFSTAERMFRALGLWDRIARVPLLGAAAGEALRDGRADAYFWNGPRPDRVTTEAAARKPVRILDLYSPLAKKGFFKQHPYFTPYTYPAGSYPGVGHDVATFGTSILWLAHRSQRPELIQKMAAAVYSPQGLEHMLKVHAAARDMTPERALLGVTIPLHKGAEEHWRSLGMKVPESIRWR